MQTDVQTEKTKTNKQTDPEAAAVARADPLHALKLGVDHQRPALAVGQDGSVLRGHAVAGELLVVPDGHLAMTGREVNSEGWRF